MRPQSPPAAVSRTADDLGLLRFLTCGSVDDGKSTLIGRLLFETGNILDDQLSAIARDSRKFGTTDAEVDYSLLMDGLEAEREQRITIDVAYRRFGTPRRAFVVADAPGHEHYTRNMATAASASELAVILVDARHGMTVQTRRHAVICGLFGIGHVLLAVNKMDLIDYQQSAFDAIAAEFAAFAHHASIAQVTAVPVSARHGDNVVERSPNMPWYKGPTLLAYLETVEGESDVTGQPFRFPVQWVNRPSPEFRGFAGTVASGSVQVGDPVVVANRGTASRVARIVTADGELEAARAGEAVTLTLTDEIDIARGDLLVPATARPQVADQLAAHLLWLANDPMLPGRSYLMRIGMAWTPTTITGIKHKLDLQHLEPLASRTLAVNEIGLCNLSTATPLAFDPYDENRATGSFILVDRITHATAAAGMIKFALRRAANIHPEPLAVSKATRAEMKRQKPCIVWFTGLPASGKSTIARLVEAKLHRSGHHTYMLDGDNVRHGLNRDLGFTAADRVENIRRVGEVAKLFVDAGLIVLCAFISPFHAERRLVRELVQADEFIEVFVDTPIEECMRRDPKGLYAKARGGTLENLTGVDSAYEAPEDQELVLRTMEASADELADRVIAHLQAGRYITG